MKTLKCNERDLKIEYIRFCNDMSYDSNNKLVKEGFAKAYIEHNIGVFGFFDNDFFVSKDLEEIKKEIISILENLEYKIIVAMAKEIGDLRKDNDLEWGEFCGNEDYYDYKKIIEEFKKEVENNK